MRKSYKNKRDEYKDKLSTAEAENRRLTREANARKEADKKRFNCIVYCSHCQIVSSVSVPRGQTVHASGCAECGMTNCGYLVSKVKKNAC